MLQGICVDTGDKPNEELSKCTECGQDTCLECLADRTPFNLLDTNVCKTCYGD